VPSVPRRMLAGRLSLGDPYNHRVLSRDEVEALATEVYAWRSRLQEDGSYWVTRQTAAQVLGVSRARLGQLAARDRLPYLVHQDGTRLYRRAQLQVMSRSPGAPESVSDSPLPAAASLDELRGLGFGVTFRSGASEARANDSNQLTSISAEPSR
jgi:hypothetical protein